MGSIVFPTAVARQNSKYPISYPLRGAASVSRGRGETREMKILPLCVISFIPTARKKRCITLGPITTRLRCKCQLSSDLAPVTSAAYGVLLFCGGLFAYARSGSKGSLLGGLTGSTLMTTAYFLMQSPETREMGYALAFGSALLFACVFGIRLAATHKIVPSGLFLGFSIGVLCIFILPYLHD